MRDSATGVGDEGAPCYDGAGWMSVLRGGGKNKPDHNITKTSGFGEAEKGFKPNDCVLRIVRPILKYIDDVPMLTVKVWKSI